MTLTLVGVKADNVGDERSASLEPRRRQRSRRQTEKDRSAMKALHTSGWYVSLETRRRRRCPYGRRSRRWSAAS